jgi:TRAP-type C4-dicarboxylate transport system permease small subunit
MINPSAAGTLIGLLISGIRRLSTACGFIAALLIAAACLVVCQMVFVRYFSAAATVWQTEFVVFCVVCATFIGSPYVLLHNGHVYVDLISTHLPRAAGPWFGLLTSAIACVVCLILAWLGWLYFIEAWRQEWVTESVWAPRLWIPLLALPVGLGVLSLQYLAGILQLMMAISKYADTGGDGGMR